MSGLQKAGTKAGEWVVSLVASLAASLVGSLAVHWVVQTVDWKAGMWAEWMDVMWVG